MNKFKIIFLCALGIVDIFLIMISAGYLSMAIKAPNSLGGREVSFTGNYILFGVYCILIIAITTTFLICLIKWLKMRNKL